MIAGYTSDGLIEKYDLVVLEDNKHAIPPYDAIMLVAPKRAGDQALQAALKPLLGRIDIADMREANLRAAGGEVRRRRMRWRAGCGTRSASDKINLCPRGADVILFHRSADQQRVRVHVKLREPLVRNPP